MNTYFLFKAVSNSMYPIIRINDIILIKRIEYSYLNLNDIVGIKNENKIFVHRIIKKSNFKGVTKGDNNKSTDGTFLTTKNYIGKAFFILRNYKITNIYDGSDIDLNKMENDGYLCHINDKKLIFNEQLTSCILE